MTLPLVAAIFLTLSAAPALGALTHPLKATFGPFSRPSGIAIDAANGNVFVANSGSQTVEIFGPEGGPPTGVSNAEIPVPNFNSQGRLALAIDNANTSLSKGALYIADTADHVVKKYTLNPLSEEYEPAGELSANPAFGAEILSLAVDSRGNVFVGDAGTFQNGSAAVVEFSPTGTELARFAFDNQTVGPVSGLAFDSVGNLYAEGHFGQGVWKFAANGSGEIEQGATATHLTGGDTGIAVDQDTDTLYVGKGKRVAQYSTSCVPVGGECEAELEFGFGILGSTTKLAVSPLNGDIYVSDQGNGDVAVFDATLAIVPDPVTKDPTAVKQTAATLNGTVSAATGPAASCEFQYTSEANFKTKGFEGASTAPCSPAGPFTGTAKEPVKAEISGLGAETAYVFRLIASNENGPSFGEVRSFATVGKPKIDASFVSLVTHDSATVNGEINPNGGPGTAVETTYLFEYVSAEDFETSGYANATKVPAGGEAIGSGIKDVKVTQQLSGLTASTTYHFRLVAENEAGEETAPDKIFATFGEQAIGLPDGRVYEQVTPVDKNGAAPEKHGHQAALDGDGITYLSRGGIPGGNGAQEFPEYLASRGLDWSTQGLLPPASNGSAARVLGWSEDLSEAYVTQAPLPADPATLYQRDSATGSLRPIAEGPFSLDTFTFVATSADASVVIFESSIPLPPGGATGAGVSNTYAWDAGSGELSLVGVLSNGLPPAKGTLAGSNQPLSRDQFNRAHHAISEDGSRVFFTDAGTGLLYLRENPTAEEESCGVPGDSCTVQVSASKRAVPDPKGKKPAAFTSATPDGSRALFTSSGKLTDDATTGPNDEGNDLYRYDAATDQLIDLTPDAADPKGADVRGVLGASDDDSYVYFAANGVLAAGATPGNCSGTTEVQPGTGACNLYLWHDGVTVFVAPLKLSLAGGGFADSANWHLTPTGDENTARVSADGQTLLFRSQNKLTVYDNEGTSEFYLYRVPGGELSCVSCNPSGAVPLGAPYLAGDASGSNFNAVLSRNLSPDGKRVFFQTPDKLVSSDTDGDAGCPFAPNFVGRGGTRACQDAYEWEAKGTGSCQSEAQNGGCLYLLSSGTSAEPSFFADAGTSGEDAFIFTAQSLVGQDKDQIVDIYDARIGGGIASQNPPPPPVPCEGEACKEGVPPAPSTESPGTASFSGPGNQKASQHKKKKHHHKKKRHHRKRQASKQRQASGKRR